MIEKLKLAYNEMDLEAYMDCMADSFVFHWGTYDWPPLPEMWEKAVEETIHQAMFDTVERIELTLALQWAEHDTGSTSSPTDDTWRLREDAELLVTPPGLVVYYANTPQLFVLAVDENRTGPRGETLWAIVEWYDLALLNWDEGNAALRAAPGVPSSWGSIKSLYR